MANCAFCGCVGLFDLSNNIGSVEYPTRNVNLLRKSFKQKLSKAKWLQKQVSIVEAHSPGSSSLPTENGFVSTIEGHLLIKKKYQNTELFEPLDPANISKKSKAVVPNLGST